MRALFNAIVAVVAVALVLMLAFGLVDLASRHGFAVRGVYSGVRAVRVDSGSGNVTLIGDPGTTSVTVTAHVTEGLFKPKREASLVGGVLRLHSYCHSYSPSCSVSYHVTVPAGILVFARSGDGEVRAVGIDAGARLELSTGAGGISATGVRATVITLSSGAGSISARLSAPAQRLSASSGVGDVKLEVPDAVYRVDASSGVGHVSDRQIRTDPAAARRIDASSGAGDVTITPTG